LSAQAGKRRRWLWVYLVLLAASFFVQLFWPGLPAPRAGDLTADVQRQTSEGPVTGGPVRIAYTDAGDGPVLILIHGSPGSKENFARLAALLTPYFRVIAVDLPGFGASTRSIPDYSIKAHARYVLALMDALGIDAAQVLGFSMGSGVALHMAELAPGRVRSLIFYGGIGIQEGEGSGDYYFEHLKYAMGYGALVVAPELIPHFGLLGSRSIRHSFIRNFWDTDQRPLRAVLESLRPDQTPLLILHGRDDPLVPAWTAYRHHQIVGHSELVMFDASHFMVFSDEGSRRLAEEIIPFAARHADGSTPGVRRTLDHTEARAERESPLPFGWDLKRGMSPWAQMGVIIGASYILEDPTTVFTGLMIAAGQIDLFVGVLAVFIGIFTGDLALYLLGYVVGRRVLGWSPLADRLPTRHVERLGDWFDRHGWQAVLASRFIPGSRLPLYVSAGALGRRPGRFVLWTLLAVAVWAVAMVLATVLLGEAAMALAGVFGRGWLALIVALALLLVVLRVLTLLFTSIGRARLKASIARLWRWEFWPVWLFYLPVIPWVVWLSLRHRGFATVTAVNPGMPDGGFVHESKIDILNQLPGEWIVPSAAVTSAEGLRQVMSDRGWSYPLILKPDTGERGYGVKKITCDAGVDEYFARPQGLVLAQVFDPGPFEAGVFYYRVPGEASGHIFSITDKAFPVLQGDGRHTFEQLIYRHRRYRMQAGTFLKRFGDERDRVLAEDERLPLVTAGNHCQGAIFLDGAHLVTPELERVIDGIARTYDGFYFGRFDVRYSEVDSFKAGRGFKIVELNGATSESTHIYDPKLSLFNAYRTLYRQWSLAFAIGSANRKSGAAVTPIGRLLRTAIGHYRSRPRSNALAD
jgi:pimeloyl-ACP methyl ester carboxylesterase/membrane protein DedA with SNARE-associated domain